MVSKSCQASYIVKPRRGKGLKLVALSDKCNGMWDLPVKAAVRLLCSSLVSTCRKTNLMVIFLQNSRM